MAFNKDQIRFFAQYIQKELGIVYTEAMNYQLESRLDEIVKSMGLKNSDELYSEAVRGISPSLKKLLLDTATNNETSFFRDGRPFKVIQHHIIPKIKELNPKLPVVRIWCAASSFGQEPYSLAMLLSEMSEKDSTLPRFEITATDISEAALQRAKLGKYSQLEVQRGLPAPLLLKYFSKDSEDNWQIKSSIRINVQYKKQNLLDSFITLGDFEFILCRNVLIYQNEENKKDIIRRLCERLTPKGFLMLGGAEGLIGLSNQFEQHFNDGALYFQKR